MTFIDLAIIYLACGAPLSMHYFFGLRGKPTVYFIVRGIAATLFWPVAAVLFLTNSLRRSEARAFDEEVKQLNHRLDALRSDIESFAFADGNAASAFEFREVFGRYTGLVQAVSGNADDALGREIFQLSGHSNTKLATRCLNRTAAIRLSAHANAARFDFVELIAYLSNDFAREILLVAVETAELIGDEQTVYRLRALIDEPLRAKTVGKRDETWFAAENIVPSPTRSAISN